MAREVAAEIDFQQYLIAYLESPYSYLDSIASTMYTAYVDAEKRQNPFEIVVYAIVGRFPLPSYFSKFPLNPLRTTQV